MDVFQAVFYAARRDDGDNDTVVWIEAPNRQSALDLLLEHGYRNPDEPLSLCDGAATGDAIDIPWPEGREPSLRTFFVPITWVQTSTCGADALVQATSEAEALEIVKRAIEEGEAGDLYTGHLRFDTPEHSDKYEIDNERGIAVIRD